MAIHAEFEVNVNRRHPVTLNVIPHSEVASPLSSEYQQRINAAVLGTELSRPPRPWKLIANEWHDGSTHAVGITRSESHLVCTDFETRWIISTETGEMEFDDSGDEVDSWWNHSSLSIMGFGPTSGESIRTSGFAGSAAGFHLATKDGWSIYDFRSPAFQPHICLQKPGDSLFSNDPKFDKIAMPATSLIAFGFSPSGNLLFVFERDEFEIWKRAPETG